MVCITILYRDIRKMLTFNTNTQTLYIKQKEHTGNTKAENKTKTEHYLSRDHTRT